MSWDMKSDEVPVPQWMPDGFPVYPGAVKSLWASGATSLGTNDVTFEVYFVDKPLEAVIRFYEVWMKDAQRSNDGNGYIVFTKPKESLSLNRIEGRTQIRRAIK